MRGAIKTHVIGGYVDGLVNQATGSTTTGVVMDWQPQDNIRIVGLQVLIGVDVSDAASNADGQIRIQSEVSRSGVINRPGALLGARLSGTWNAGVAVGTQTDACESINFPEGTGVDLDMGDTLNLLFRTLWIGTGALPITYSAIIHYIER